MWLFYFAIVVDLFVISIKNLHSCILISSFLSFEVVLAPGSSLVPHMSELISSGICNYCLPLFTVVVLTFVSAYNVF